MFSVGRNANSSFSPFSSNGPFSAGDTNTVYQKRGLRQPQERSSGEVNRRPDLFRKFLGRLRMILCYWKTFSVPENRKSWMMRATLSKSATGRIVLNHTGADASGAALGKKQYW